MPLYCSGRYFVVSQRGEEGGVRTFLPSVLPGANEPLRDRGCVRAKQWREGDFTLARLETTFPSASQSRRYMYVPSHKKRAKRCPAKRLALFSLRA